MPVISRERLSESPDVELVGEYRAYVQRVRYSAPFAENAKLMTWPDFVFDRADLCRAAARPVASVDIAGASPADFAPGGTLSERDLVGQPGKPVGPFVILGAPGSGKSTLLRHLALSLTDRGSAGYRPAAADPAYPARHAARILATDDDLGQVAASAPWLR